MFPTSAMFDLLVSHALQFRIRRHRFVYSVIFTPNFMSMFAILLLLPPNGQENKHLEHAI